MLDPDRSFMLWQLCQSVDWAHLPKPGGWLDQDDLFLHDMVVISRRLRILRQRNKADQKAREEAAKQMGIKGKAFKEIFGK